MRLATSFGICAAMLVAANWETAQARITKVKITRVWGCSGERRPSTIVPPL
jgi:hypothetical protein